MDRHFFQGIKQWEISREGFEGKLPVFYYDTTSLTAIYTASTNRVEKLLPLPQMKPIEMVPGRCLVAFTAFEYRQTDIDAYNEFSIAFLVTYDKPVIPFATAAALMAQRKFTAYVWQLPVTTEVARVGGVEFYGYPKFIADIEFRKEPHQITCNLSENGEKILSLTGSVLPTKKEKHARYVTYSVCENIPLVTNIFINPIEMGQSRNKKAVSLEIGTDHSISEALQDIGLSQFPVQYQYSPLNQGILFPGRNMIDD